MDRNIQEVATPKAAAFFSLATHPIKFRLYLLKNVPAALFSGLKIIRADSQECTVSVPYRWITRNPFRSTYFASLSMAAEMSTGVLAMASVYGRKPAVSLLIVGLKANFRKKATGPTYFTCVDGDKIAAAVSGATTTGEAQEVSVYTAGKNAAGDLIAEFWIQWSFRRK